MKRCKNANDYRAEIKRLIADLAATNTELEHQRQVAVNAGNAMREYRGDLADARKKLDAQYDELVHARLTIARLEGYIARVVQVDQSSETRQDRTVFGIPCENGSHYQIDTHYSAVSRLW